MTLLLQKRLAAKFDFQSSQTKEKPQARGPIRAIAAALFLAGAGFWPTTGQAQTTVAGVTEGALSIGPDGSAGYSIPIKAPPGIAGMEPSISLNYSGGSGIAGIGWSIGGLSSIGRCGKTWEPDNEVRGVQLDAEDRFCLGGQRLVAISGAYGADGTEYRTEIESFTKVVSYGTAGSGPAKFKAWTKSGQIIEFGYTSDSQANVQGKSEVVVWAANKITDTAGNYLTLSYLEDVTKGSHNIDRIDYAGNAAAGVSTQSSIRFLYETRPDTASGYFVGASTTTDQRLINIQSFHGANLVRDYSLAYEQSATHDLSRLISVTECDGSNNCFEPITFTWTEGSGTFEPASQWIDKFGINQGFSNNSSHPRMLADVNGDGLSDVVGFGASGTFVSLSTGSSFQALSLWVDKFGINQGFSNNSSHPRMLADVNGDGLSDVVGFGASGTFVSLSTGSSFQSPTLWIDKFGINQGWSNSSSHPRMLVDVNGDGLPDIVGFGAHGTSVSLSTGSSFQSPTLWIDKFGINQGWSNSSTHPRMLADVNGDDLPDVVGFGASGTFVSLSTGSSFQSPTLWIDKFGINQGWSNSSSHPRRLVDVNGDGLPDIVGFGPSGVQVSLSTGTTFQPLSLWIDKFGINQGYLNDDTHPRLLADVNSDGLPDIVGFGASGVEVSLSTGSSFQPLTLWIDKFGINQGWSNDSTHPRTLADVNGDGLTDIVGFGASGTTVSPRSGEAPDHLTTVTDSLGTVTSLTHKPITDTSVYTKGSGSTPPVIDLQGPMYVVSEVSTDDGVGGQARTTYAYENARAHAQGRGFLGFELMHVTNELTGLTITTEYRQDYPFIGLVASTETYLPDQGPPEDWPTLKKLTNSYDKTETLHPSGNKTVFPHLTQSVAESYEINDGPNNQPITTVTNSTPSTSYDAYGNVTSLIVETVGNGETYRTTTDSTYTNDTANWILGRVTRTYVTQELPDLTTSTRSSAFDYDSTTGLLSQEKIEPDLPAFKLTTDYIRDTFGNITSTTVSGSGITSRTTTTAYSTDGRFPVTTTNALGHSSTSTFDPATGTVLSQTGPNGITTSWEYDGFARRTREHRADGTSTIWEYRLVPAGTTWSVYYIFEKPVIWATQAVNGPINLTYFDHLNRVTLTRTDGFDGTFVYVNTNYNDRGEVSAVSLPYFGTTPPAQRKWTTTSRDIIGRALSITTPDGGTVSTVYDGLTATTTNQLGQTAVRTKNALGQLVLATDNAGNTVTYTYDHHGNLLQTDAASVITTMTYDIRGRKTSMDDPDMGYWTYDYNVLGELTGQTDAKSQTVTMTYDLLGRMVTRTEPEGTTTWTYDNALKTKAIGKPDTVTRSQDDYAEDYVYDSLGRPSSTTVTYETKTYVSSTTYDASGRVDTVTYPSGFAVQNGYNAFGYLEDITEVGGGGTIYWRAIDVDAEGRVVKEQLGNDLTTLRDYDPADGALLGIQTFRPDPPNPNPITIQDLSFTYDLLGNLTAREDLRPNQNRKEAFTYDNLNRLTASTLTDTLTQTQLGQTTYGYDALGNMTSKSDVGAYIYGGLAGPHAVTAAGGKTYAYDANGSMTSTAVGGSTTRSVGWSSFNKPTSITDHTTLYASDLVYGPSRGRIKQTITKPGGTTTLTYLGAYETETKVGAADKLKHYISAGTTVAIYTIVDDGLPASDTTRYLHRDHLGSLDLITDESGNVAERRSHDAHGLLRQTDWQAASNPIAMIETPRGFTGHEHLDAVGLIHMNGRVYDPILGRFLSADPFVQAPEMVQSYNRYSYVANNPLSYTDPSGFFFKTALNKIGKLIQEETIAKKLRNEWLHNKIVDYGNFLRKRSPHTWFFQKHNEEFIRDERVQLIGGIASSFSPYSAMAWAAVSAEAHGGDFEDAARAAGITAIAVYGARGIGSAGSYAVNASGSYAAQAAVFAAKTVAHGALTAVTSKMQGGSFRSGFLAGAVGAAISQVGIRVDVAIGGTGGMIVGTAIAAVGGGVGSHLGGGKFRNGAISAAFIYLYNHRAHESPYSQGCSEGPEVCAGGIKPLISDEAFATVLSAYPVARVLGGLGRFANWLKSVTGGWKQWFRWKPSFSVSGGFKTERSLSWGASPAKGGKYLNQIGSPRLRELNQWLRNRKLPGKSWRTQDPGHFHWKKK